MCGAPATTYCSLSKPLNAPEGFVGSFASYWYRGHIYANNASMGDPTRRGLDVLATDLPELDGALRLDRTNA